MTRCKDCGAMYERKQFPHCPVCIPEADTTQVSKGANNMGRAEAGPGKKLAPLNQNTLTDKDPPLVTKTIQFATVTVQWDLKTPNARDCKREGRGNLGTLP